MSSGFVSPKNLPVVLPLWSLLLMLLYYLLKYVKYFTRLLLQWRSVAQALQHFPGPPRHWFHGHLHQIPNFNEGLTFLREQVDTYPRLFTLWSGPARPFLVTCHPETCKHVLKSTLAKPVSAYSFLRPWLGDGLLFNSEQKWFHNRRLHAAAFPFDVLKPYMRIYNEAAEILMEKFSETNTKKQSLDVFSPVSLCTLDVMLKCAFSSDMDVQRSGDKHQYVNGITSMSKLHTKRALNPIVYPTIIHNLLSDARTLNRHAKLVQDVFSDVIKQRRKSGKEKNVHLERRHPDFLDILLLARNEDGSGLTEREIRDEADTFLLEGHDTTSSAISWALYTLAQHPEHQQKCYEEISSVLAGRSTQNIEWDDFGRFPYLTMCIKESMRLHTPVPMILRKVETEFELDGVTLPVGTSIYVHIHLMHNNKAVWGEDCHIFKPERFASSASGNGSQTDFYAFIPFSTGPRNCVGQIFAMHEIKVIIARIISRYSMKIDPLVPAIHLQELVTRAEHGLYLYFESRRHNMSKETC